MAGENLGAMPRVRPEFAGDHGAVFLVNRRAFPTALEAELVEALRPIADPLVSLVAEVDGRVVGHVLFTPVTVAQHTGLALTMGLAPVAVLPEFQGQGIGSALISRGLEDCRNQGHGVIFVLGKPAYYGRLGFHPAVVHGLRYRDLDLGSHFMVLELLPGALAGCSGQVRYLPPFDEL